MPRATLPEDLPGPLKQALETQAVIVAKNSFRVLTEKHHAGHLLVSCSAADILDGPCACLLSEFAIIQRTSTVLAG